MLDLLLLLHKNRTTKLSISTSSKKSILRLLVMSLKPAISANKWLVFVREHVYICQRLPHLYRTKQAVSLNFTTAGPSLTTSSFQTEKVLAIFS